VTISCTGCDRKFEVPVTQEQIIQWRAGALIQRVMPELSPDQRELLMSQTCGECWDAMFVDEEEA
jgi:hypothetical protein